MPIIIKHEVKTYIEKWVCGCGGEMVATGEAFTSIPLQHVHKCTKCKQLGKVSVFKYPRTTYEIK